ncbi:MAG: DUF4258 domain-containing protein [Caldilineaceae bacterium]|nr:DUF4258 domain-containing protein [Caldilineaceae bacterium]HRJ43801.1 DUF4258 domain-containing protein [Caldilineaceae bacterium]
MRVDEKQRFIRQKAIENESDPSGSKVYWSRHAIGETVNDDLTRVEVERAFQDCEIIEDYPVAHRPLPDCLLLAWVADERPLHAVVAIDEQNERIFVVTVYVPSKERWSYDWRIRK